MPALFLSSRPEASWLCYLAKDKLPANQKSQGRTIESAMEAHTYESDDTIPQYLSSLRYSAKIFKAVSLYSAYFSLPLHSSPIIRVFLLFTVSAQPAF